MSVRAVSNLVAYVPTVVIDHLRQRSLPLEPCEQRFDAAMMLADVSGFTRLAERLERKGGPQAAEELMRILNAFFDAMIETITQHGGDVVKFAGDAMLVVWPAPDDLATTLRRAGACGLALQSPRRAAPSPEFEKLALKVALSAGPMRLAHLGGVRGRFELMVTGEAVSELASVASRASTGEVSMASRVASLLSTGARTIEVKPGVHRLESVVAPTADVRPPREAVTDAVIAGYVPETVLLRTGAQQREWLSDLRRATVMFVNFPNATHETTLARAQGIMELLQTTLDRYEGTLNKLSFDDKGVSVVAVFGLPPLAHDDDPARAVLAALALHSALLARDVRHAMGITTAMAFCGVVGNERRREYTVMGDGVNLAARLMQHARDDILCDSATAASAASRIEFVALAPIAVKGKRDPVSAFRPSVELRRRPAPASEKIVGRAAETTALLTRVSALLDGATDGVALVEGEPGIGKSRLVAELCDRSSGHGAFPLVGWADAIECSTAYYAWRSVFARLLDVDDPKLEPALRRGAVRAALAGDPQVLSLLPLLESVLPLGFEDNELTAQMAGPLRAENTRELLLRILERAAPLLLVLEDAHWLDSASWALVLATHLRIPRSLIVLASRPMTTVPRELQQLLAAPSALRITLDALSPNDAVALVAQSLGVGEIPDALAQLVRERAAGHPLFSEEIVRALRDAGQIEVTDGRCTVVGDLARVRIPGTVQGVINGRVDRLAPQLQLTLKVASVIGRVFAVDLLRDVYPIESQRGDVESHLDELQRLDLTPLESPPPARKHIFKHVITHQVVYDQILVAQRRALHAGVADWLERHQPDDAPLLAHHCARANDVPRTQRHLDRAGEQALQRGAYHESVQFIREAIGLERAPAEAGDGALTRARRRRALGDAELGVGRLDACREHLEAAVALLEVPMPTRSAAWMRSALEQVALQVAWRFRGSRNESAEQGTAHESVLEAARTFERLGVVCFFQNEPLKTLYSSLMCANLGERAGPSAERARAYANLHVGTSLMPMPALAKLYRREAVRAIESLHDLPALGWIHEALALVSTGVADFDDAERNVDLGLEIHTRLGDLRRCGECQMIEAAMRCARGEFARVESLGRAITERARRTGDEHMESGALAMHAYGLLRRGVLSEARDALVRSVRAAVSSRAIAEEIFGRGLLAWTCWLVGDTSTAAQNVRAAVEAATRTMPTAVYCMEGYAAMAETAIALVSHDGRHASQARQATAAMRRFARTFPVARARALLLDGMLRASVGDPRTAIASWRKSLAHAERTAQPYERARAHVLLSRVDRGVDATRHAARAADLFAQLGITADGVGPAPATAVRSAPAPT